MGLEKKYDLYFQAFYIIVGVMAFVEGLLGYFGKALVFKKFDQWIYIVVAVCGALIIAATSFFIVKEMKIKE